MPRKIPAHKLNIPNIDDIDDDFRARWTFRIAPKAETRGDLLDSVIDLLIAIDEQERERNRARQAKTSEDKQ